MRFDRPAWWTRAILAFVTSALLSAPLYAEERIALVIGNSRYANLLTLPSAARDAEALAESLRGVGFDVEVLSDADQGAVTRAIEGFGQRLDQAAPNATGLFNYSGYGVQQDGANYLLPSDIDLNDLAEIGPLALPVETVLQRMTAAGNPTNIVILDASRAHPYAFLPGAESGLAEMQAPAEVFLSSAAAPGTLAFRGGRGDSLFSAGLNKALAAPALPIDQLFEAVRQEVETLSEGQQIPWFANGLSTAFRFDAPAAKALTDDELWAKVQESRDPQQVVAFIRKNPTSPHVPAAGVLLSELLSQDDATPGTGLTALSTVEPAAAPVAQPTDAVTAGSNKSASVGPAAQGESVFFGMSLEELLLQSPVHAPFEGLPQELWQNEQCSTCHTWTTKDLCEQGLRYQAVEIVSGPFHPLGGAFRSKLKELASAGCD
ncbi:caspase family protein [Antarctobacter jejuensis]|uniref:caspase family protein n=1 Tax=Antarctobacter jejuensis TaxID=1439938 RepID=UPI003FD1C2AA